MIDLGLVRVKGASTDLIEFDYKDCRTRIFEIMRADFNGDGTQDLLIYKHCSLLQGTLHFGGTEVLTRHSNDSIFSILNKTGN